MTWESSFTAKAVAACDLAAKAAWTHPDSAASRAYYAVVAGMSARLGPPPTGLPGRHGELHSKVALDLAGLPRDAGKQLFGLYRLRVQADYHADAVEELRAALAAEAAAGILATMGSVPP